MNTIRINKNTKELSDVINEAFDAIVPYPNTETISVERWLKDSEALEYDCYGLVADGKIVALAAVGEARDKRMKVWQEIMSLYVHPEYKDIQYGATIIKDLIELLDDKGHESTYVWVLEENYDIRDFYEKQCFVPNGNRDKIMMNDVEEGLLRYVFVNL